MDIDILKIRAKHAIENGRLLASKALELFGLDRWADKAKSKRTREIETVLERMTEAEKAHLMKAKGAGHVSLYQHYRTKYLGK